ncbi:MAG: PorV/PorQ family protein [Bacteroidota bacterium]
MKKAAFILGLIGILVSNTGMAQLSFVRDVSNKGTVAASFLEIGVNARAEAMGGAYAAQKGTPDMVYWNPAGIAYVDGVAISFSNTEWLANTQFNFASAAIPLPGIKSVLAASFTTLGVPDQDVVLSSGERTGEQYDARDLAVNISFASRLIDTFSFGVTAKYINQRIWSESATGIGFDVGVHYQTPIKGLTMGSSISNFGDEMSMSGRNLIEVIDPDLENQGVTNIPVEYVTDGFPLPQIFRFGLAYDVEFKDASLITAVDLMHPTGSTESMNLGAELGLRKLVFIRAGYQNLFERDQINGLTYGAGIQYKMSPTRVFSFDYSVSDWGILGNAHRISMNINL